MIKFDIVLACFNGEKYIKEQLDSIITSIEYCKIGVIGKIIISDDSSSDNTKKIINEYILKYPYIHLISNDGKNGVKGNFQNGLIYTTSEYIFLSDQDDVWFTDKIELSLNEMIIIENIEVSIPILVLGNLNYVDENLNYLGSGHDFLPEHVASPILTSYRSFGQGCTMLLNRALLALAQPIPQESVMHDWWILLVASNFGKVKYLETPLMNYRQHNNNVCGGYKNNSLKRYINIDKQKKYINEVSLQSQIFLNRFLFEINNKDSKKIHQFLSELGDKTFLEKILFYKFMNSKINGIKSKIKFLIQLIVG
ncbi:glycosyltransferase [Empedobacter falsenii]